MSELSLEAYRFALDNTVDSVVITDIRSVIQYVNPAFTTITGFTAKEAVGGKPSILRSRHTTLDTYKDMWSIILSGGWWRGEIINVRKTGEEWYSYLSISQIKDSHGKAFAYVGIAKDITELKMLQFELKEAGLEGIFMLSAAAEAKDELTGSHLRRVQHYSEAIALRLGLSKEAAEEIGYSSMMHDVGKIHIPDNVLKKNGPLSDPEWASMAQHPESGASILRDKPFYAVARDIASNHHEKWDGSGYPSGKRGEKIPLAARIVAVADVFDALTTHRPYKRAWSDQEALEEIAAQRGHHFDPQVVDAFFDLYREGTIAEIRKRFPTE
ncbi:MAG TPA: PAS domain S-box protein [Candidatus Hydrogenedentes bacterium]|nr:PAS domain S-box protein [Candidatus Hydrogenedentota bacterium]HPG66101.1 PAS domain S-box protein [Candidatus Hydrogenedentota bacterium]